MKFTSPLINKIEDSLLTSYKNKISKYNTYCKEVVKKSNYDVNEASLCLPSDTHILHTVQDLVKKKKTIGLKYIIDIGIGGSNLGTKAIYDALYGSVDFFNQSLFPKIIFLDTTDPEYIDSLIRFIKTSVKNSDEILVNIISKSGGTTETAVNAEIVINTLKGISANWKERIVVTTDKHSQLWENAIIQGIDVLEIPKKVGGRYSVFSSVGLFPLLLCGVDVDSLLEGARNMREICMTDGESNFAALSAIVLYDSMQNEICINDNFYFHSELESLGKWYRQLMGESIGKLGMGLTPTVSMGSVDLHSMVQLYLGGPKNKITSFVYTQSFKEVLIPKKNSLSHLSDIQGRSVGEVMRAIQEGTIAAYESQELPLTHTILEGINPTEIGAYMQFKMIEMMYLAHLMNVNAFDQPQVELYKIETKRILLAK